MSAEETPCSSGVLRGRERVEAGQGRDMAKRERLKIENCKMKIADLGKREFVEFMGGV